MNDIGWCKKNSSASVKSALHQCHDVDDAAFWPVSLGCKLKIWFGKEKTIGAVDKLMHIHRNECVELADLCSAVFLSSFDPSRTQALSSRLRRT